MALQYSDLSSIRLFQICKVKLAHQQRKCGWRIEYIYIE